MFLKVARQFLNLTRPLRNKKAIIFGFMDIVALATTVLFAD
jgi:hypothetical protein